MKKLFAGLAVALMVTGCSWIDQYLKDHKDEIHQAIINYAENEGQEKAIAYINQLEAEGKLGHANAEKLRAAVPQGVEKLKEAMKEQEEETTEEATK